MVYFQILKNKHRNTSFGPRRPLQQDRPSSRCKCPLSPRLPPLLLLPPQLPPLLLLQFPTPAPDKLLSPALTPSPAVHAFLASHSSPHPQVFYHLKFLTASETMEQDTLFPQSVLHRCLIYFVSLSVHQINSGPTLYQL